MFQLIKNQRDAKLIPEEPSITSSLYNELPQKKKALLKKPRNSAATELMLGKFFYSRLL
ncbi:hypothetical protein Peur_074322 [Populus x canadensis]|jgi:hypothetical protein